MAGAGRRLGAKRQLRRFHRVRGREGEGDEGESGVVSWSEEERDEAREGESEGRGRDRADATSVRQM